MEVIFKNSNKKVSYFGIYEKIESTLLDTTFAELIKI